MNALAFFTPEFEYHVEAWTLMMEEAGFTPHAIRKESRGEWGLNTNMKPSVIVEHSHLLPLLYTDIDATVEPGILERVRPHFVGDVGTVANPDPSHKNRIAAAMIWLNPGAEPFIRHWARECATYPTRLDHGLMTRSMNHLQRSLWFQDLTQHAAGLWTQNGLSEIKPSMPA